MFQDSTNKQIVRCKWDKPILSIFKDENQRNLSYFGMPGAEIKDLLDWRDLLSTISAVQIVRNGKYKEEDLSTIRKINLNVQVERMANVQILRGAIEEIIINGYDMDNNFPNQHFTQDNSNLFFQYDLVNLDFVGGVGYKSRKGLKYKNSGGQRLDSIRKLIERQKGHSFLLMLTVNVRDTLGDEPMHYLMEEAKRYNKQSVKDIVDWTISLEDDGNKDLRLKTWIPLFIKGIAETNMFYCHCYPPLVYEGHEKARMVHFVFSLKYDEDKLIKVSSPQDEAQITQLPLIEVSNGEISMSKKQYPKFDVDNCKQDIAFLGDELVCEIVNKYKETT